MVKIDQDVPQVKDYGSYPVIIHQLSLSFFFLNKSRNRSSYSLYTFHLSSSDLSSLALELSPWACANSLSIFSFIETGSLVNCIKVFFILSISSSPMGPGEDP